MQGTVITNKGLQLIAKLVASGTVLSFTRAAVGTGSVPSGYDPTNMTGLNKYKMDGAIASCSSSGDTASIIFQVSSIGVSAGFTITEAGLFATDPDEGEILYCYLDMSTDPQYIYAEGSAISKFVEMTLTVVVGSVQSVTAYINPGSLLTNDGDISNTTIETLDNITESFPVPVAKEKSSKFFGKIKKSLEDWKNLKTSLLLVGSIINNCVTDNANLPLSAAQGKALMDLYIALNSDLGERLPYTQGNAAVAMETNVDQSGNAHLKVSKGSLQTLLKFWPDQRITIEKYNGSSWSSSGELLGNADIQKGRVAALSCPANTITEHKLVFPKAFTVAPRVMLTLNSSTESPKYGSVLPFTTNITSTGCTIRVANNSDTTFIPNIEWFAIAL